MHHNCTISGRKPPQALIRSTASPSPSPMERGKGGQERYGVAFQRLPPFQRYGESSPAVSGRMENPEKAPILPGSPGRIGALHRAVRAPGGALALLAEHRLGVV